MVGCKKDDTVDFSLQNLTGDWIHGIEERFAGVNGGEKASTIRSYSSLDMHYAFVEEFFKVYPLVTKHLLASKDKAYFLASSERPCQKSVLFIPVLNATLKVWFKN
jgi:fatty acid synthase subunit alpha, fungi type